MVPGRRLAEPIMFSSIRQLFSSEVFALWIVRLVISLLLSNEIRVVRGGKKVHLLHCGITDRDHLPMSIYR